MGAKEIKERTRFLDKVEEWGFLAIDSTTSGLGYVIDPKDRGKILIATTRGKCILTKTQAETFAKEVKEIISLYMS